MNNIKGTVAFGLGVSVLVASVSMYRREDELEPPHIHQEMFQDRVNTVNIISASGANVNSQTVSNLWTYGNAGTLVISSLAKL
jgi:hypothetical protein